MLNDLLSAQGWSLAPPPRGNVLLQHEYREHAHLRRILGKASKAGSSFGVPEAILLGAGLEPLAVIEAKASVKDIDRAVEEAIGYARRCVEEGYRTFAIGLAGTSEDEFQLRVMKWARGAWHPVTYGDKPIGWIPNRDDLLRMAAEAAPEEIRPTVPPPEVLVARANEINRLLRESSVKDEFRPAVVAAAMLALWQSGGNLRRSMEHILGDINQACAQAFWRTKKPELSQSIRVDEANIKLQENARRILSILERLNVGALTAEHDYLGQLYETFFHYTGGNTIGQYFTPRHVATLMADLADVGKDDVVLDPACGTGGFLVAAMNRVFRTENVTKIGAISLVAKNLIGFDSEPVTASLAVANMILRGDGSTGIHQADCFTAPDYPVGKADVVLMNPPFPHKSTDAPTERFVERALEGLKRGGRAAMIVPMSRLVKSDCRDWRDRLRAAHTVNAVIWLSDELFEPYASAYTAIVVMTKGIPHPKDKATFFAKITNDGFRIAKSFRHPSEGDETPAVLRAYGRMEVIAGLTGVAVIPPGGEWGPGAYIPARPLRADELIEEVSTVVRNHSAAVVRLAPQIQRSVLSLDDTGISPVSYRTMSRAKTDSLKRAAGTIGASFDIYYGQRELHSKGHLAPGDTVVISSSGTDNGIYGFFDFEAPIAPPFATVPSTGSIGQAAVQTFPCGVTDDCLIMLPRPGVPVEALYVACAVIRRECWRFNYGRKITPARIEGFPLPLDSDTVSVVRQQVANATSIERQAIQVGSRGERARQLASLFAQWDNTPLTDVEAAMMDELLSDLGSSHTGENVS